MCINCFHKDCLQLSAYNILTRTSTMHKHQLIQGSIHEAQYPFITQNKIYTEQRGQLCLLLVLFSLTKAVINVVQRTHWRWLCRCGLRCLEMRTKQHQDVLYYTQAEMYQRYIEGSMVANNRPTTIHDCIQTEEFIFDSPVVLQQCSVNWDTTTKSSYYLIMFS